MAALTLPPGPRREPSMQSLSLQFTDPDLEATYCRLQFVQSNSVLLTAFLPLIGRSLVLVGSLSLNL